MKSVLLRFLVSVFFVALLFYVVREDIPSILHALKNVHKPLFAASVGLFLLTVLVLAKRLEIIFAADQVSLRFRDALNLTFVGYFFNNFLPTSVGGDIVKAMCASRLTGHTVKSVTSVLLDRIFGLFTFILIPSVSFLFFLRSAANPAVPTIIYSLLMLSVFFFFLLFNRGFARKFGFIETLLNKIHLGQKVRKLYDSLHSFKNRKKTVALAMALSLIGQTVSITVLYLMAVALGAHAPALFFYLLVPVVHLLSMLPSLNGLGIREGAYVYFLSPYIGREYAAALGILWLGLLFLLSFVGAAIYLARPSYHIRLNFKTAEVV